MIVLPRQAQDKHRENLKQEAFFAGTSVIGNISTQWLSEQLEAQVRKCHFCDAILPRQARDMHRESTQKREAFFLAGGRPHRAAILRLHCPARAAHISCRAEHGRTVVQERPPRQAKSPPLFPLLKEFLTKQTR